MATTQLVSNPPTVEPLGRRFAVHLGGVGLANLADGIVLGGVPLIAVMLTRSPGEVSLLQVAFWLPWLLFGLVAGVVIDRADRRHVQLVAAGVRAALLALLTWLAVTDQITMPLLIGAVGIYGVTQVFVDLAGSSIIPQLAPRSRLSAANGRVMGMEQALTTFVGGPLAGLLLAIGAGWVFGVPVALGVAFLLLIGLGLRGDYRAERADDVPAASSRAAEILEGLRFQLGHAVLRPLLVSGSVFNFASTGYFAVFVLWMVGPESQVGLEPQEFPLLVAVLAVGAVAGSAAAERLARRFPEVRLLVLCWGSNAVLLAVPVLWPHPAPIAAAFFALGFTNMVGNVISRTLRQRLVPPATLGRVGGAGGMIAYGLMPLGALLAGVVGELWGLPVVFLGAVGICLTAVIYVGTQLSDGLVRSHDVHSS